MVVWGGALAPYVVVAWNELDPYPDQIDVESNDDGQGWFPSGSVGGNDTAYEDTSKIQPGPVSTQYRVRANYGGNYTPWSNLVDYMTQSSP